MLTLGRILCFGVAFIGLVSLIRTPRGPGLALVAFSLLMAHFAQFLVAIALVGAVLALIYGDPIAMLVGLVGAAIAFWNIASIVRAGGDFDRAFGAEWRSRIPSGLARRMLRHRFYLIPPEPQAVPCQRDLTYATHAETGDPLVGDLWQPPADVPVSGLGIIYFHGSAWHYMRKGMGTDRFFRFLATQGHVVLDAEYYKVPKGNLHSMVADVKRAIHWMKTNSGKFGIQPDRIVLMGGSAGAHLALLAAYAHDHPQLQAKDIKGDTSVRAVVAYYPATDMAAVHRHLKWQYGGPEVEDYKPSAMETRMFRSAGRLPDYGRITPMGDYARSFMGGTPEQEPDLYQLGSPICHVTPACPPTLIIHGAYDTTLPPREQSVPLVKALQAAGVPAVYVELPFTEHGFDLRSAKWSPAFQAATYDVQHFLALMV